MDRDDPHQLCFSFGHGTRNERYLLQVLILIKIQRCNFLEEESLI